MSTTEPVVLANEERLIEQVREAWADVLLADDVASVPLDVNFLEAGGNSLMLIMLWEQLNPLTERQLKVSELFQHSTVRAQAALLAGVSDAQPELGAKDRGALLGRARRDK